MQTAGARALREDDQEDMSREAVLLQWERKIEAAERSPGGSELLDADEGGTVAELRPTEDATHREPRRFERRAASLATAPVATEPERRTITITGQPTPARRRRSVASPSGRSCWACSWWLWPPGPRTPRTHSAHFCWPAGVSRARAHSSSKGKAAPYPYWSGNQAFFLYTYCR